MTSGGTSSFPSGTRTVGSASLVRLLGSWRGRGPTYRNLAEALRLLVLDGRVPLHVALPGERELSGALGVSRTTVAAAYAQLRDDGFLFSQQGARSTTRLPAGAAGGRGPAPAMLTNSGVLDLAYASLPACEGAVHQAFVAALEALPEYLPGHGYEPVGLPALRESVAQRYTARGLPTSPDEVLITSGAQHAVSLLIRLLASPGDRVLVDNPTYPHVLDAIRQASCRALGVGLPPDDGWDVDGIRAAVRQSSPRLGYLVPDFHNPTGRCMDEATREAVGAAARNGRMVLVVDETLVDLGLDVAAPSPLASFVDGGHVVTVGSTAKSFWGGLRIGWVRGDADLIARLADLRATVDLGTPVLEQLATVALLGDADAVLASRRETLRLRRAALLALLAEHLPLWRAPVPLGGLSLWAELPAPVSTPLAATAERFGVRVGAGPRFGVGGGFERFLRLPFTLPEPELTRAVERLAQAYAALGGTSLGAPGSHAVAAMA